VVNLDHLGDDDEQIKYKSNHFLMPQSNFRMLCVGGSGCGKSNTILCMIYKNMIHFDKLYIFSKHLHQSKYVKLMKYFEDEPDMLEVGTSVEDIPPPEDFDSEKQNLVIFDDLLLCDQKPILELFIRGRHSNISMIYIGQCFFSVPKSIRMNCSHYCLFDSGSKREMGQMATELGNDLSKETFMNLYNAVCEESYGFFYIDKVSKLKPLRYRKNFDCLYNGNE
jgi:hypothetical protein